MKPLILLTTAIVAHAQFMGGDSRQVTAAATPPPAIVGAPSCAGGLNGTTASVGNTTGAKGIYAILTGIGDSPTSWSDTYSNSPPQKLSAPSGSPTLNIYYWENPTTGAGHSFTVTYVGGAVTVCVAAFSGVATASSYESGTNISHRNGASGLTVQPGSTSPMQSGYNLIITGAINDQAATGNAWSINSGYSIAAQLASDGATYYGSVLGYLVQVGTAASNPTWTDNHASGKAAVIAVFKGQ